MGKGGYDLGSPKKQQKAGLQQKVWKSGFKPQDPNAFKLPSKGEIKSVIPKECFEQSTLRSLSFVLRDCTMAAALVYAAHMSLSTDLPDELFSVAMLKWLIGWNMYAFWQGAVLTGLWVLAHECGHAAFSSSQLVNDVVGFVLHQALLVPYFNWQYTHAKHHRRTNHLMDGESHVPSTAAENGLGPNNQRLSFYAVLHESVGDDVFAVVQVLTHLVLGWPLYLLGLASTGRLDAGGNLLEDGDVMDHFRPGSKMFPANFKLRFKIAVSTLGIICMLAALTMLSLDYGFLTVFLWYGAPYMWVNVWLVLYTWLQHTDPSVPQFGSDEWTWVKGALCTIDRDYGIFDFFHHKIGSTHVAHHFFHQMPFYKADVATQHIKKFLGPLYNYDPTSWYLEMWRIAHTCHYVDDTKGVQYFKSLQDVPHKKTK